MKILVNLKERDEDAKKLSTHTLTAIEIKAASCACYNKKDLLCIDLDNNIISICLINSYTRENVLRILFTTGCFDLTGFPSMLLEKEDIYEKVRDAYEKLNEEDD